MIDEAAVHRGKILIVDDKAENVAMLEEMLRREGYTAVTSTTDGSQVCALHLVNHYDLIVLDLVMPKMDGFQVMENLKEIETGGYLPVLVITARPDHVLRALRVGAKDFVARPFAVPEVLLRVYNMLEVRLFHNETSLLYKRVLEEHTAWRRLMGAIPANLAAQVMAHPKSQEHTPIEVVDEAFAEVTVMFMDLLDFTRFAEGASAEVLVSVLQAIAARFDRDEEGVVRGHASIVGDAYLGVLEVEDPVAERTIRASKKAVELIAEIDRFNGRSPHKLNLRITLNTRASVPAINAPRSLTIDLRGDDDTPL